MDGTRLIDDESDVVLQFDDGVRIPCVRYVLRLFSPVVFGGLFHADTTSKFDLDSRGREILPIPCRPSETFAVFVELLHLARGVTDLELKDAVAAHAAADFMACDAWKERLEHRIWRIVRTDVSLQVVLPHVQILLRNADLVAPVMRKLIKLCPLWCEFKDMLEKLDRDEGTLCAVARHASRFFPPELVAHWVLDASKDVFIDRSRLLTMVTEHGSLYHPREAWSVLKRLGQMLQLHQDDAVGLFRLGAAACGACTTVPVGAHGTMLEFHDEATTSVRMDVGTWERYLDVAGWLRVGLRPNTGALDIRFSPHDMSRTRNRVQLRVMCFDSSSAATANCCEVWFLFNQGVRGVHYTLENAVEIVGEVSGVNAMLSEGRAAQMRLDFFFDERNVLEHPYSAPTPPAPAVAM